MTPSVVGAIGPDGIAELTLVPRADGPPILDEAVLEALEPILEEWTRLPELHGVLVRSGDPDTFCAGADVRWLRGLCDRPDAATAVAAIAARGQRVLLALERLAVPTVALIDGACLGGGLELAMACRWRCATDRPATRLGLPEVRLGLVPGLGGTQRLPRLVGLARALTWILQGRVVNARQARRAGLVDAIVPVETPASATRDLLRRCIAGQPPHRRSRRWWQRALEGNAVGRSIVFGRAARAVADRAHRYPALTAACRAVQSGYDTPGPRGYAAESSAIGESAASPVARHLLDLFLRGREAGRNGTTEATAVARVGVLGAGVMGAGLAHWCASRGVSVLWRDLTHPDCARGMATVAGIVRRAVRRDHLTSHAGAALLRRITPRTDLAGFERADGVIEAVFEDAAVKRRALAEVEAVLPEDAWIATNTSTMPVGSLASAVRRPARFLGLHFFNPVRRMELVEVIAGPATDPTLAGALERWVREDLGRTPIRVSDTPGFLVNRCLGPYLAEAAALAEAGADPDRVDAVLERFGMALGPFATLRTVGLWTARNAARVLRAAFGARHAPTRLLDFAQPDRLGGDALRRAAAAAARSGGAARRPHIGDDEILERCLLMAANEAAWALHEGVVADPATVDLGMVFGTGFAPWTGGPLRWIESEGRANIAERLRQCAALFGDRFTPAPGLA